MFSRVFVVKLKPQQSIQQLPSPEQNPVFSYDYVHEEANGGTYMADVFDKYVGCAPYIVKSITNLE